LQPLTHAITPVGAGTSGGHGVGGAIAADATGGAGRADAITDAATTGLADDSTKTLEIAVGAEIFAGGSHADMSSAMVNPRQTAFVDRMLSPHRLQGLDDFPERNAITT